MTSWFTGGPSKKQNNEKTNLLQKFADQKNIDINSIKKLLNEGGDPYAKNEDGLSAFDYMDKNNNLQAMILSYKSSSNSERSELLENKIKFKITEALNKKDYKECASILDDIKAMKEFEYLSDFAQTKIFSQGKAILDKEEKNRDENISDAMLEYMNSNNVIIYEYLEKNFGKDRANILLDKGLGELLQEEKNFLKARGLSEDAKVETKDALKIKAATRIKDNKVTEFLDFLDKKPPLGTQFENSLAKEAIDYACAKYNDHPEILTSVLNLIKEQNINRKDFGQQAIKYLGEKSIGGLTAPKQIEFQTIVCQYNQFFDPNNSSLSEDDINNLSVFAKKASRIEHLVDGMDSMSKGDITAMHDAYQSLPKEKLPKPLLDDMDALLIEQTNKFVNARVRKKDIKTLNEFAGNCADSEVYLKHLEENLNNKRDIKTQEHLKEYFSWKIANDIMQQYEEVTPPNIKALEDIVEENRTNLSQDELDSFTNFFSQFHKNEKLKLPAQKVEKIANCIKNSQGVSKLKELAIAISPYNKDYNLSNKQLEEFTEFLSQKPLLGDIQTEDGLAERAFNIAKHSIATNPELIEKIVDLAKNEYESSSNKQALKELAARLQEFSINSEDDEIRKKIEPSIEKMRIYLRHDSEGEAQEFIMHALKRKDYSLASKLIIANKDYELDLKKEDVVNIINNCSKEALATIMNSEAKVESCLKELQTENDKEIKLIWEHIKDKNIQVSLDKESINKIASAVNVVDTGNEAVTNQEKYENLKELLRRCAENKKDESLVDVAINNINKQDLTEILKDFYKQNTVEDDNCLKLVASSVLKNNSDQFALLEKENIEKLVHYYNPHEHSSKFLEALLDAEYEKAKFGGGTKENASINFANIIIENLKKSDYIAFSEDKVTDAEKGARAMAQRYFEKKRQYEKQPIWTKVKAFCHWCKLEDYKARKLLVARDAIATELKKDEFKKIELVSSNQTENKPHIIVNAKGINPALTTPSMLPPRLRTK